MNKRLLLIPAILLLSGVGYVASRAGAAPQAEAEHTVVVARHVGKTVRAGQATRVAARQATSDLAALKATLEAQLPGVKVPTVNPFGDGVTVHTKATGSVGDYRLLFAEHAAQLTTTAAPLALKKVTPTSTAQAQTEAGKLAYRAPDPDKTETTLGAGLTGTVSTATGQATVSWRQGDYAIIVADDQQDPTEAKELAKNVVSVLASNALPRTATRGAIVLHVADGTKRQNTVSWRETSAYYTISGDNAMATLRLAFGVR
ncbi:hypothetical protein [Lacticaseibacillus suihuaensis]